MILCWRKESAKFTLFLANGDEYKEISMPWSDCRKLLRYRIHVIIFVPCIRAATNCQVLFPNGCNGQFAAQGREGTELEEAVEDDINMTRRRLILHQERLGLWISSLTVGCNDDLTTIPC